MRPTPRKPERPVLWIVAGPNGSGKSSFYNRTDIEGWGGSVWIINPDLLTERIAEKEGLAAEEANLEAVQRIERWLHNSVEVHQTIGVETVLSSEKYRALVQCAQQRGFEVRIIHIVLRSADLQVERVRIRVAGGGHDVPEAKIRERRARSFRQFAWFLQEANATYIYDNSTGEPEFLGGKIGDVIIRFRPLPADLQGVLDAAGVEFVDASAS
jgi:predicted ABC-type ATPase